MNKICSNLAETGSEIHLFEFQNGYTRGNPLTSFHRKTPLRVSTWGQDLESPSVHWTLFLQANSIVHLCLLSVRLFNIIPNFLHPWYINKVDYCSFTLIVQLGIAHLPDEMVSRENTSDLGRNSLESRKLTLCENVCFHISKICKNVKTTRIQIQYDSTYV